MPPECSRDSWRRYVSQLSGRDTAELGRVDNTVGHPRFFRQARSARAIFESEFSVFNSQTSHPRSESSVANSASEQATSCPERNIRSRLSESSVPSPTKRSRLTPFRRPSFEPSRYRGAAPTTSPSAVENENAAN